MKLIDILVEELPKMGGWPEGATRARQSSFDTEIYITNEGNYVDHPNTKFNPGVRASDCQFNDEGFVTREQYEAALAASKRCDHKWVPSEGRTQSGYLCSKCGNYDGPGYDWIDWPGGECPAPRGTLVDVKYLCGDVNRHIKAGEPDSSGSIDTAFAVRWSKLGAEYDIIAYRLHQPQEVAQDEADDENDLNECIGQDAAPVWNGDGLPPVGMEIEYSFAKVNYRTDFSRGKVLAYGMQNVFMEHWASKNEFIQPLDKIEFRPIRSEADRKRDAAVEAIDRYMPEFIPDTPNDYYNAKKFYDAIAAGKVPGVKLED